MNNDDQKMDARLFLEIDGALLPVTRLSPSVMWTVTVELPAEEVQGFVERIPVQFRNQIVVGPKKELPVAVVQEPSLPTPPPPPVVLGGHPVPPKLPPFPQPRTPTATDGPVIGEARIPGSRPAPHS